MATSGSFGGNGVSIGGYGGNYIFTNWQLASQNVGGNYSTINWQTYFHFQGADAQLDNGNTAWNGGYLWTSGRDHNFGSTYTVRDIGLASGSFNIGHDGAGNATLNMSNHIDVYQSGSSNGSGAWGLPTIPRYANIDGYNIDWATDASIRIAWHADRGCDYISWWSGVYDGGGHHDEYVGNSQGWFIKEFYNLRSDTTYDFTVAVRNAASGLWTTSGTAYPHTGHQNNFFDVGDM